MMSTFKTKSTLWTVLLIGCCHLASPILLKGQSFDYLGQPDSEINYTTLDVELGIQPQNLMIDGSVTYQFKAEQDSLERLAMDASNMEISYVQVDSQDVDFSFRNDSLVVALPFVAEKGKPHSVKIRYSSNPTFGLLKDYHNSLWTSMLPHARQHWIPVVDNPHNKLKTSFTISLPADYQVWATGNKVAEKEVNEDVMQYQFKSDHDIPVSEIGFALGKFKADSISYADKSIYVALEQSLADSVNTGSLLQKAKKWISELEKTGQDEYPFDNLTIVMLEDHKWEPKSWGASMIYLYENRGDLETQLLRGLTGQWLTAKALPARWKQADAATLYQTMISQIITGATDSLIIKNQPNLSFETVYAQFSPARWNAWQKQWKEWNNEDGSGIFTNLPPEILGQFLLDLSGDSYSEYWKNASLFQLPIEESKVDSTGEEMRPKPQVYDVQYQYNEADGSLSLSFHAEEGAIENTAQVRLYEAYDSGLEHKDIEFSGMQDSLTIPVSEGLRSAWIEVPEDLNVELNGHKSVSFLLYAVRNAGDLQQRSRAARSLGEHTDNPDIQLAVNDVLSGGIEPEVRAGLLKSLADITAGATGTEQDFIEALHSEELVVQTAGLYGLKNYPENEEVQQEIKQLAANVQDSTLLGEALLTYADFVPVDEFQDFLKTTTAQDSTGRRALTAVKELFKNQDDSTIAKKLLSPFLSNDRPFEVRRRALYGLTAYDNSSESWLERGKTALSEAADPRIRYLLVKGMLQNSSPEIQDFLSKYRPSEYDARVFKLITKGL